MFRDQARRRLLFCVILFLFGATSKAQTKVSQTQMSPQEIQQTIDRVLALESRRRDQATLEKWVHEFDDKGCWPDIPYDNKRRAQWVPMTHASRLRDIALASYDIKSDDPKHQAYQQVVIRGLNSWLEMKLESPNWWHNQIGVPELLDVAAMALGDALPQTTRDGLIALSRKHVKVGMTGANKVWLARNVFYRGLLAGDTADVRAGINAIQDEIIISKKEGIQPDMSFHQHGPILMTNGYGLAYMSTNLQFMAIVEGTSNAFTPENKAILTDMLLDGTSMMTFKGQSCPASMGRSSSRKGALRRDVSGFIHRLLTCNPPRREELESKLAQIQGDKRYDAVNRMYYASDFMIHQRPDWQVSIKMFSDRIYNSDGPVNQEGLRNAYMSQGSTFLMMGQDEYIDLPGVWDWQYLPGTTVGISPTYKGKLKHHNGSAYAGGVSDGQLGATGFMLDSQGLSAHLAWFCFDDCYFVLGSDLKQQDGLPIVTTFDQCYRKTPVWIADDKGMAKMLADDVSGSLGKTQWIWHRDVVYVNYCNSITHLAPMKQTGNWGDINIMYHGENDVSADVFRSWLEHTDGKFAYAVYPMVSVKQAQDKAHSTDVRMIRQDAMVLAVHHTTQQVGMAIFFVPDEVTFSEQIKLSVDHPLAVMVRKNDAGRLVVTVASPTLEQMPVTVTLNGQSRLINLPTGLKAGSSVTVNW